METVGGRLIQMVEKKNFLGMKGPIMLLHKSILNISKKDIAYDVYPIYVTYYAMESDKVFAILYPNKDHLDLGLAIDDVKKLKNSKNATYMKYLGVTRCVEIKANKDINKMLVKVLKDSYNNVRTNKI